MARIAKEDFFFSEEKKQKTFASLSRFYPAAYAKDIKVFPDYQPIIPPTSA